MNELSAEIRKALMKSVKSKNTKVEKLVFSYLRQENIYFQKHYSKVIGHPDIALPRKKLAVFIDGDFWHGKTYENVLKKRGPNDYWTQKVKSNMERDLKTRVELREAGWQILTVWESDLLRKSTQHKELQNIKDFLLGFS